MLAAWRIGAITSVVFSGFAAEALADRIEDAGTKLLVTADGLWRRGRVVALKEIADRALERARSVEKVVVVRRLDLSSTSMRSGRDLWWYELEESIPEDVYVEPERLESEHPPSSSTPPAPLGSRKRSSTTLVGGRATGGGASSSVTR